MADSTIAGAVVLLAIIIVAGAFYAARTGGGQPGVADSGGLEEAAESAGEPVADGGNSTGEPGGAEEGGQAVPAAAGGYCPLRLDSFTYKTEGGELVLGFGLSKPNPCYRLALNGYTVQAGVIIVSVNASEPGSGFCIQVVSMDSLVARIPLDALEPGVYSVVLEVTHPKGSCRIPAGLVEVQTPQAP